MMQQVAERKEEGGLEREASPGMDIQQAPLRSQPGGRDASARRFRVCREPGRAVWGAHATAG